MITQIRLFSIVLFSILALVAQAQTFSPVADFSGVGREGASSFVIGNQAFVGLGGSNGNFLKDFYKYDASTNTWTAIASFPGEGRMGAVAFTVNGKGYVGLGEKFGIVGGTVGFTYYADFYAYDPGTNAWTAAGNFAGAARSDAYAFVSNGSAYVGCGKGQSGNIVDHYKFNPSNNTWTATNDLTTEGPRAGASSFVLNNVGYVSGGGNGAFSFNDLQSFNGANNTWTQVFDSNPNLLYTRGAGTHFEGKGLIGYGSQSTMASYDPVTNTTTNLGDVLGVGFPLLAPVAFTIGNDAYFGLGLANGTGSKKMYKATGTGGTAVITLPKGALKVFPTVTTSKLTIEASRGWNGTILQVQLVDQQGVVVQKQSGIPQDSVLSVADLANGVYYLLVETSEGLGTYKIIKK